MDIFLAEMDEFSPVDGNGDILFPDNLKSQLPGREGMGGKWLSGADGRLMWANLAQAKALL